MTYRAPVADIAFTLKHSAGLQRALEEGLYGDLTEDVVDAVLEEAGKFASTVIAPLNAVGDKHGTPLQGRRRHDAAGLEGGLYAPGRRAAGTGSPVRPRGAGRGCRTRSTRPASRCGTRPRWRSASDRC